MLSKAISFGRAPAAFSSSSRCARSLWRKICLSQPRLADALDHRIVVVGVGQDQAVRDELGDGRDAGLVRDVAGGEDQRRLLAVQVGEFALERDQRMIGAGDVAGAARAGAHPGRGLDHGADHLGMLAHAEIVVGAPDHDLARPLRRVPDGVRETGRRSARDRRTPGSAARRAAGRGRRRKTCRSSWARGLGRRRRSGRTVCFRRLPRCLSSRLP